MTQVLVVQHSSHGHLNGGSNGGRGTAAARRRLAAMAAEKRNSVVNFFSRCLYTY